jgi:hypothetical protein
MIFFYRTNAAVVPHWQGQTICGYVYESKEMAEQIYPNSGCTQIVDLFSTMRDDMHFWCAEDSGHRANLESTPYWNKAVPAFYAPGPTIDTFPIKRMWNPESNTHIFTENPGNYEYTAHNYQETDTAFYVFNNSYGPRAGLKPLFRWHLDRW